MNKSKIQNPKSKSIFQCQISKSLVLLFVIGILSFICHLGFGICHFAFAQSQDDLELILDVNSNTMPLPKIFKPNIDLSGRGFHPENTWPQNLSSKEALSTWQKDIGFDGLYRIQLNLWEIAQLAKDNEAKSKITAHYETIIKSVHDAGGTVILDIFGTPVGMGKVLDKKSSPLNLAGFKELVKETMKDLSCDKKYRIWYEVWGAPDLEDFFLGRQQDYFNLYRVVSEAAKELESQYKIHIPVGAPSTSSWFQGIEGNTILTPEDSLIYALIKFCYQNHLNLDFVSWHGYATDPKAEKETTIYDKNAISLMRDWLSYFSFDKNTPLIVSEWNYDREANLLPERKEKSYITASYIPARLKNMQEAGLDNQVYFCLEDFQNNKEGVTRNVGVFYFNAKRSGGSKASYNVFKMLKELGQEMVSVKLNDEFVGALATKAEDKVTLLIYNYIDPDITKNSLSENIAGLNPAESKFLLGLIRSDQLTKIIAQSQEIEALPTTSKVKSLLKKAAQLDSKAESFKSAKRSLKINLKNIKGDYLYTLFTVDPSCSLNCEFKASLEKEISATGSYQEDLVLNPYSVNLVILKKKPEPPKPAMPKTEEVKPEETPKDADAAGI